jgi:hypothetical protein
MTAPGELVSYHSNRERSVGEVFEDPKGVVYQVVNRRHVGVDSWRYTVQKLDLEAAEIWRVLGS